jgi:hypothetical protein
MLSRVATVNRQHPEGLIHLIENLRNHDQPNFAADRAPTVSSLNSALNQTRDFEDPQGKLNYTEIKRNSDLILKSEA